MTNEIPQTRAGDIAYGLARGVLPQRPSRAIAGFVDKALTPPQQGDFDFSQRDAQIAQIQQQQARVRAQQQARADLQDRSTALSHDAIEQYRQSHSRNFSSLQAPQDESLGQFVREGLRDIPRQAREAAGKIKENLTGR